ncbi:hypothetical protein UFOVP112_170 [uncultured Caudovirales phage]|uniref:Uncharacterized protein n=1 Tax=uncultured Caudovirales phage TaxID=2100421 RepID=A0A6J5L690_9CAUD|nr:hypothetical protein UFOVP112_170 [uncultured Caudovirales phage]
MATPQIRQTPNPATDLPGNAPMSRQGPNPLTNPPGGATMSRQAPNPVDNFFGNNPMIRQEGNAPDDLSGKDPMVRQPANTTRDSSIRYPMPRVPQSDLENKVILRDYRHAARIFTDDQMRLSPKYGFLFYVEFDFNPLITNVSNLAAQELGMIVKTASLPKFTIETKTHNAYNRKNIVQNSIKYDPVNITFHDDQSDNVRNFWYDYYSYFYRDPDYADSTYSAPHKYQTRPTFDWGYTPRPAAGYNNANAVQPYQYIQAIRIYSLYQQNFSEYELINPVITSFKHGEHTNGQNELLQHEMTVQFETVKYLTGYVTRNTAGGFIDLHYDNVSSPNPIQSGQTAPGNNSDQVTDLANAQQVAPILRDAVPVISASLSDALGIGLFLNSSGTGAGLNAGGISLPGLGSLTQGLTSGAMIQQSLTTAGINIAGSAVTTLANGVVGGVAAGLGSNGKSIIGLAAAAISNPNAVLKTAENMAITFATGIVMNAVNGLVQPLAQSLSTSIQTGISTGLSSINTGLSFGGASTFTGGITASWGDLGQSFNNFTQGAGFITNATLAENFASGTGVYALTENIGGIDIPFSALNP